MPTPVLDTPVTLTLPLLLLVTLKALKVEIPLPLDWLALPRIFIAPLVPLFTAMKLPLLTAIPLLVAPLVKPLTFNVPLPLLVVIKSPPLTCRPVPALLEPVTAMLPLLTNVAVVVT